MEKTITPRNKKDDKKTPALRGPKKETLHRLLNYSKSVKAIKLGSEQWLVHLN